MQLLELLCTVTHNLEYIAYRKIAMNDNIAWRVVSTWNLPLCKRNAVELLISSAIL